MLCVWMEPGRHELCMVVHRLVDKYPCPEEREMPGTARLVVSIQVLLQVAWRAALVTLSRPVQKDI